MQQKKGRLYMYEIELVQRAKNIIEFENYRLKSFGGGKIKDIIESQVAVDIASEEVKAYTIKEENKVVGGIVLKLPENDDNDIFLNYLFVNITERNKGIGSYMLNYLEINKDFFSKNCKGIKLKPTPNSFDFYQKRGFIIENNGPLMKKIYRP